MLTNRNVLLCGVACSLLFAAWMFRYDSKPADKDGLSTVVTDRWTGTVYTCSPWVRAKTGQSCERVF